eukprot:UN05144
MNEEEMQDIDNLDIVITNLESVHGTPQSDNYIDNENESPLYNKRDPPLSSDPRDVVYGNDYQNMYTSDEKRQEQDVQDHEYLRTSIGSGEEIGPSLYHHTRDINTQQFLNYAVEGSPNNGNRFELLEQPHHLLSNIPISTSSSAVLPKHEDSFEEEEKEEP